MKRYVSLEEISDGRLYGLQDMAKVDCLGCRGCSACCRGMGDSILLDPYDVYRLQKGLGRELGALLAEGTAALGVVDGVILPHLAMRGREESCGFLSEEGRCSVHAFRPGFCRLFPLGRYYEKDSFRYFVQKSECDRPKAKIRIAKWLETEEPQRYEGFVICWHNVQLQMQALFAKREDDTFQKNMNLFFLRLFFLKAYDGETDFYVQFDERLKQYQIFLQQAQA